MPDFIEINKAFSPPMPVVLVGTASAGQPNFMAVAWCVRVNSQPPMIAVSIGKKRRSAEPIMDNKAFSVCLPQAGHKDITDYCGVVSAKDVSKADLFNTFYKSSPHMPMIADFPVNLECSLVDTMELPDHYIFAGEIIGAYGREDVLENGKVVMEKIDPLVLTMYDNRYWRLGECVGSAWKDGLAFKKAKT